jgi:hypothetical protein
MAHIIRNDKQVQALHTINDALSEITAIDTLMNGTPGKVLLVYDPENGRDTKIELTGKERERVNGVLLNRRRKLVKSVYAEADKNKILLDDADKALLGNDSATDNTEAQSSVSSENESATREDTSEDTSA